MLGVTPDSAIATTRSKIAMLWHGMLDFENDSYVPVTIQTPPVPVGTVQYSRIPPAEECRIAHFATLMGVIISPSLLA